ncbi:MAG: mechanosensitive ion channel family protein [Candidatus Sulfomarinibacteraceae bacterium]
MIEEIKQRFAQFEPQAILDTVIGLIPDVLAAGVVLMVFYLIFRLSRRPLRMVFQRAGMHDKLVELLVDSIYRYGLAAVGLVMAASQLGINVGAAIAGLGVAGIAVGFAAQDSLANVISGIIVFLDKPFIVGDWITVEDEYGQVTNITLRSTRIRTPRNSYVVIPNKRIIDTVLENHSKHGRLRVDVPVGIAYKEDIRQARSVILDAVAGLDGVLDDPEPDVVVDGLGSSSVDLVVRVWIDAADRRRKTTFSVVEASKLALDDAGIEIPFPHLQLFVDNVESEVWDGAARLTERLKSTSAAG